MAKVLDEKIGPLNGCDWRQRWQTRLAKIFATQEVLVGELNGELAAMASATVDGETSWVLSMCLAWGGSFRGAAWAKRCCGMIKHLRSLGCRFVNWTA